MLSSFASVLTVVLLAAQLLPAQLGGGAGPRRKSGTIYKHAVDELVGALRDTARRAVAEPAAVGVLGGDVLSTARILAAMGHCHRRYHVSDGPVVRPSLRYLLQSRRADGSFGDADATVWTVEALAVMDPESYGEELRSARAWLAQNAPDQRGFDAAVATVIEQVRADRFPEHLGDEAAAVAHRMAASPDELERGAAAAALVHLVACQAANRELDRLATSGEAPATWSTTQERAFAWLWQQQQEGVFAVMVPTRGENGEQVLRRIPDPAFTGFGLMALMSKPRPSRTAAEQAAIDAGMNWLLQQQNEDGTFGEQVPNYTTCVVVGALSRWHDSKKVAAMQRAQKAILGFQNLEATGYSPQDRDYGSIGYGNSQRGDLSNLHFSIEALRQTGLSADHEALKKALVFLQRTQNLKASNDYSGRVPHPDKEGETLEVTSGDDGGAVYYPGNSNAGYLVRPDGKAVPRSYGSMTYALLKSYTLAGVDGDDPRVQAAVKWIQDNWTLAVNPGSDPALGEKTRYAGLFYYYMVLAQALDAAGIEKVMVVTDAGQGTETRGAVDWRKALHQHLSGIQGADGSWVNGENGRWMESLPLLCTCYAMVALEHCW